jgi:hypothetical protein
MNGHSTVTIDKSKSVDVPVAVAFFAAAPSLDVSFLF